MSFFLFDALSTHRRSNPGVKTTLVRRRDFMLSRFLVLLSHLLPQTFFVPWLIAIYGTRLTADLIFSGYFREWDGLEIRAGSSMDFDSVNCLHHLGQ